MQKIQELIVDSFTAQKNRIFLWVPFFLSLGIGQYFSLKSEPSLPFSLLTTFICLAFVIWCWRVQQDHIWHRILLLLLVATSLIAIGFTSAKIRSDSVYTPMILKKIKFANVEGDIHAIEPLKDGSRIILKNLVFEKLDSEQTPKKIRIKMRKDEGLSAGQRVKLLVGLNPPSPPNSPNAFDFQRWSYFQGLGAVGFSYGEAQIIKDSKGNWLSSIRAKITNNITENTTKPEQSIILALMTGQRKAIIEEDWDAMRESGLAHMLAISGLHVGMVAGTLFFFSRLFMAGFAGFSLRHPIKKYAALFALTGAFLYMLMVGATIPTQRAVIMVGLAMVAICLDRSPISLRLVALAAIIILIYRPESLVSISFQMSFAAVTALVAFFEAARPYLQKAYSKAGLSRKVLLYFIGLSCTTIIAGSVTGLFGLFHFQQYALYGLLANLIAVPILSFLIMPLLVLSYFLMPLGLSGFILSIAQWATGWVLAIAHWVANMEGAVLKVSSFPAWIFIGMVLCFWMLAVWKGRLKLVTIPVFIVLFAMIFVTRHPDIQITKSSKLFAIRDTQNNLWLSSYVSERFTAENWLRANGQEKQDRKKWPKEGKIDGFPLSCDAYGCRGEIKNNKVSISFTNKAWREDCDWADVIISQKPVSHYDCNAPLIIDYFDLWRNGGHSVWLDKKSTPVVKTVEQQRGKRLWSQTKANQTN